MQFQFNQFGLPSKFSSKINDSSLKARKQLYLPCSKPYVSLNLKKATIQAIVKKQGFKRASQTLWDRNKLFQNGLWERKVEIKPSKGNPFNSSYLSLYESDRYRQMLLGRRNIQTLQSQVICLPFRLLKTIWALKSLQKLGLVLRTSLFIQFPRVLESFHSLRELRILLLGDSSKTKKVPEEKVNQAFSEFSQALLSRKHLQNFFLIIQSKIIQVGEGGIDLLIALGQLNLSYFRLSLPYDEKFIPELNRAQPFLEKLEHLEFVGDWNSQDSPNKLLVFFGKSFSNYGEILMRCPSLRKFSFPVFRNIEDLPATLGKAKSVKEIKIRFPPEKNPLLIQKVNQLISETTDLDFLILQSNYLEEDLGLIHSHLKDSKLQKYHLLLYFSTQTPETEKFAYRDLCQQIGKIQSLQELTLHLNYIDDGVSFEQLFPSLSNLKKLDIFVKRVDENSSNFPFESLSSLDHLETLKIIFPTMKKAETLSILPKMPSLKMLTIQDKVPYAESEIQMNDYKKKFATEEAQAYCVYCFFHIGIKSWKKNKIKFLTKEA